MRITRFGPLDPMTGIDRTGHKLGPAAAKAGRVNSETITESEISEIKNLSDDEILSRKIETEDLIEEMQIRLSVLNIDFARRVREKNDRERAEMEARDKQFKYLREDSRRLVDEFQETLMKKFPEKAGKIRAMARKMSEDFKE